MEEYVRIIATATGISGAFLAGTVFLLKRFFEYSLNRELEKTKSTLEQERQGFQNKLDQNLEEYKNKLNRFNSEFNIKLSSIQGKRIEVTEQLYKKLFELQSASQDYTSQIHPIIVDATKEKKERERRVNESFAQFSQFYFPNKIYFHKSLCIKIDGLFNKYFDSLINYGFANSRLESPDLQEEFRKTFWDDLKKHGKQIREEIPPIIEDIENDLRKIIGVE